MTPDCRNDCIEPLLFPKRPNNRPGLSHIDYRIGTYSDFREALLRNLNKDPVLAAWTHRRPDDPGIALLEGASILGDILTFYQELYANEAYLRTAQWRESIADLVRLLGYRLAPGLGGKGTFAFEVKGDKPVIIPKGFPVKAQVEGLEKPTEFETVEEIVAYPALSKFNLYRPFYDPDINITTGSRKFSIETSVLQDAGITLNKGDRLMLVASPSNPQTQRQIAVVAETRERFERTEIIIDGSWQGEQVVSPISAYKLGRSFRYFGYNAPPKETVVVNGVPSQTYTSFSAQVGMPPGMLMVYLFGVYYPLPNLKSFPLDQQLDDIPVGSTMLVTLQLSANQSRIGPYHFFERKITKVTSATLTRGPLTGDTTVVELESDVAQIGGGIYSFDRGAPTAFPSLFYTDIRTVEFREVIGEKFTLKSARTPSTADGSSLYYYGDSDSYKKLGGRSIQLVRDNQMEQVMVNVVESASIGSGNQLTLRRLILNSPLQFFTNEDFPLENPKVTVYGNLSNTTQGKTEKEALLGNGDSRQVFQTFKLPKAPLTYLISPGETPPEVPELQIYVNDHLWKRVPSFFGHGPKEEIYIVREDANGESWVQFGDGKTGARLPSGISNIVAKFRTGTGAFGALKPDTTVQAGGKLNKLDKIQLPGVISGGKEPESGEKAREAASGKIQSLDRLVSLKDFESEALAISGVSKVLTAWSLEDNIPTVCLTILMEKGREKEAAEIEKILSKYNKCHGPQRFPIEVRQGKLLYVYIDAVFGLHPAFREDMVKKAIKEALGVSGEEGNGIDGSCGLFGLSQRQFGQKEYATRIEGVIQNVEGAVWAEVKTLISIGEAEKPSELFYPSAFKTNLPSKIQIKEGIKFLPIKALPKFTRLVESRVVSCDNLHIISLYKDHLQLSIAKVESKEVC